MAPGVFCGFLRILAVLLWYYQSVKKWGKVSQDSSLVPLGIRSLAEPPSHPFRIYTGRTGSEGLRGVKILALGIA